MDILKIKYKYYQRLLFSLIGVMFIYKKEDVVWFLMIQLSNYRPNDTEINH